jgi:ABC-type nitrate/sulfonate/bicarbonate transport system ATPase subunit
MCLACRHINFYYPGTDKLVFKDLNFEISEPGFHALFGPSGVGKTSLARLIAGQLAPAAGQVETQPSGTVLYSYNLERLPGWSSIGRHLERITPAGRHKQKEQLVEIFGLAPLMGHRFTQLSLGQQNRINLARYLVQDFQLLIMDESLANVDERTRARILLTIKEIFPQTTFFYISHNVVEVAKFCRHIWVLRGPHKTPQAVAVRGLDIRSEQEVDPDSMQQAMLEVMRAA